MILDYSLILVFMLSHATSFVLDLKNAVSGHCCITEAIK